MYKKFFGLADNPFNVTPDPRYLYMTPHAEEALACLNHCIEARKGFVMLSGDVGTGKTTLLNKLLEGLRQQQIASAFVFNPRLNPFQFLDYALSDFGVSCTSRLKSTILAELNQWLLERYQAGSTAVLIVDEAQDATPELLEEIRLLTNLETPSGKLLQIVLSGQQELEMRLRLPEFRQLRQRISLRCKTYPLSRDEAREYVATRLQIAGGDRQIFTPAALDALHFYSEGIPRVINILCEDSLIEAYAGHKPLVSKEIVDAVAHELELDIYPPTAPPSLDPQAPRAPRPVRVMPATSSPDTQEAPAPPVAGPTPRAPVAPPVPAAPARSAPPVASIRNAANPPAVTAAGVGETLLTTAKPPTAVSLDPPAPPPLAGALVTRALPPPATRKASDEEIVQALKPKPAPVRPQPPSAAKPAQTPARPFVKSAPARSSDDSAQTWILGAVVALFAVAGVAGALYFMSRPSKAPAAAVSAPHASPPSPTPAEPAAPTAATLPADVATHPLPEAVAPAPAPKVSMAKSAQEKPEEAAPKVRAQRQRTSSPQPVASSHRETRMAEAEAATAPATGPQWGGLVVTANVEGAQISLDGHTAGGSSAPQAFSQVPVGQHTIVVSKPGYEEASAQVTVREGKTTTFRAQLTPAGGEINILTNPAGLSVAVDGGLFSPSPLQAQVSVGSHTYQIKLPSGRIYEGSFEMRAGAMITRRVDFSAGDWLAPAGRQP